MKQPMDVAILLPPQRRRGHPEIAYFAYARAGAGVEPTSQEDIFAVDPHSRRVRRITDDRGRPEFISDRDPAWSPDRRTLAIHRASDTDTTSRLQLISASNGRTLRSLVPGVSPEWLDAGTLLYLDATPSAGTDVWALDLRGLRTHRITDLGPGVSVNGMSWHSRAGLAIGYASSGAPGGPPARSSIGLIPPAAVAAARAPGGTPVTTAGVRFGTDPGIEVFTPAWSPAADRIALTRHRTGQPNRVGYLTLATGAITPITGGGSTPRQLDDDGPVFSPDGSAIAWSRGFEDEWREIWVYDLASRISRQLTDDAETRFKGGLDW